MSFNKTLNSNVNDFFFLGGLSPRSDPKCYRWSGDGRRPPAVVGRGRAGGERGGPGARRGSGLIGRRCGPGPRVDVPLCRLFPLHFPALLRRSELSGRNAVLARDGAQRGADGAGWSWKWVVKTEPSGAPGGPGYSTCKARRNETELPER